MLKYNISISKTAQKQLDKLADNIANPIIELIHSLSENPRPAGCKKLKGRPGYRIRKGSFRVIYEVIDDILLVGVIAVGNRKDIYD